MIERIHICFSLGGYSYICETKGVCMFTPGKKNLKRAPNPLFCNLKLQQNFKTPSMRKVYGGEKKEEERKNNSDTRQRGPGG